MSMKSILASAMLVVLPALASAEEFRLTSPVLEADGWLPAGQVFNGFGCAGGNVSPALAWHGLPPGTKSIAVTLYDPDAPTGSGWWHWVVINIPAEAAGLAEGAGDAATPRLPGHALALRSDFGTPGYGGACPPPGDKPHRYVFTAYALKTPHIDLPANATAALAGFMIHANAIGKATLTVRYGR